MLFSFPKSKMICEVCGRGSNSGKRIRLEGGIVLACDSCAKLGEVVGPAAPPSKKPVVQKTQATKPTIVEVDFKVARDLDLIEDYGRKIKAAREKLNLKQDDLGKLVNEPASFIHHIEIGHAEPSVDVARKLQAKLGVRLLVLHVEDDSEFKSAKGKELTLGDVIVVKKRRE